MNTVKAILAPIPAEAQNYASINRRSASALVNSLLVQTLYTYPICERSASQSKGIRSITLRYLKIYKDLHHQHREDLH
jgi:hypothetical protein